MTICKMYHQLPARLDSGREGGELVWIVPMSNTPPPDQSDVLLAQVVDRRGRRRSHRGALLLIFFVLGLMSTPLLLEWWPAEAARWQVATAAEQHLDGDTEGALQTLDEAIARLPESGDLYLQRARYNLALKQYETAIEDLEQALVAGAAIEQVLLLRSHVYHHMGRHDDAIKDCLELLRMSKEDYIGSTAVALNNLAYARALAKSDLDEALKNIDEAIRLAGADPTYLDTRGYIRHLLGDYDGALIDMDRSIEGVEKLYTGRYVDVFPDARLYQADRDQTIAVLLYHRSLVYDKLRRREDAENDRERVRELGFEPNDSLF